jgi:hypothetical protein
LGAHGTLFGRLGNVGTGPAPDFAINADGSGLKITADQQTGAQAWPFYVECEASWTDSANNPESAVGYAQESITVTSVKWWDVGYPIGVDMQQTQNPDGTTTTTTTPNGQMTAPQDQTGSSPVPLNVYAMPGQALTCSVTPATDWDHWAMTGINWPTDGAYAADTVSYCWSSSPSGTFTWTDPVTENTDTGSTATAASATWAPSGAGVYTLTCTMDDGAPSVAYGTRDDKPIAPSVKVIVPNFSLAVRRTGSGESFASLASVAAGGQSPQEHDADVRVTAVDQNGAPLAGVPIQPITVSGDQTATAPTTTGCATGADGTWTGTFVSGTSSSTSVTLTMDALTATVNQEWDTVANNPDHWSDTNDWDYGTAYPITYTCSFQDGGTAVPIASHAVLLTVDSLDVWDWSDDADDWIENPNADPNDPTQPYGALASFGSTTAVGNAYTASLSVNYDDDHQVDNVVPLATDYTVN